jgi:hypothetical protein
VAESITLQPPMIGISRIDCMVSPVDVVLLSSPVAQLL